MLNSDTNRIEIRKANFIRPLIHQVRKTPLVSSVPSINESARPECEKICRDILDGVDVGCLITNVHRHSDQLVHWISPPHSDPKLTLEVVSFASTFVQEAAK